MEDCRIITSFYSLVVGFIVGTDWKTAVLLLPFTPEREVFPTSEIGRLPYLYFLLLSPCSTWILDWKTAVFILPSTKKDKEGLGARLEDCRIYTSFYLPHAVKPCVGIGRLPYYYFLLLCVLRLLRRLDWKTAVLLLPFTRQNGKRLRKGLEDCRIITSFYFFPRTHTERRIGRLPYYYFLLLTFRRLRQVLDWKTAVLLLPFTRRWSPHINRLIGRLPYYYFLLLRAANLSAICDWKTAVLLLPFT